MQFTNIFTVALLAVGAVAVPAPAPEAAVEERTLGFLLCALQGGHWDWFKFKCIYGNDYPSCPYGKEWDDSKHKCSSPPNYPPACSKGNEWDAHKHKCVPNYPVWDPPRCNSPEHGWCSYSKDEYTTYNKGHPWCKKDGWNKVWCSDDKHAKDNCYSHY